MCISSAAFSANTIAPSQAKLASALEKYLAQQGNLCLGKFDWPIDVSQIDFETGTRDAVQMPVLEKLGLVTSTDTSVVRRQEDEQKTVPAKRYDLTEIGKKFYLSREATTTVGEKKSCIITISALAS